MDYILIGILQIVCIWFAFKVGEHFAYFRIARGLVLLKELSEKKVAEEIPTTPAKIEKIGNQFYAYVGNDFVAQGSTIDEVQIAVKQAFDKNPNKYVAKAQATENI